MGRTKRHRKKKKRIQEQNLEISLGADEEFQQLVQWMKLNGWSQTFRLSPFHFPATGRGLKTQQHIAGGEVLARIPGKLLMTVETASKSLFGWLFKRKTLMVQQVLAAHLVLEKHLGEASFWDKYISALPKTLMTPVFSSNVEVDALPKEIASKVNSCKGNVLELFNDFLESFSLVDKCPHCQQSMIQVFTLDTFSWAWFVINSRAVYICPEHYSDHDLTLSDSNCLALAPYLDIFNHSNKAKVQAFVNDKDGSYQIKTLAPCPKFTQVFIHYGDHSNLKLYLEYGFIMPKNIHDTIPVTFDEVFSVLSELQQTNIPKVTYSFLKSHGLLDNMYLSSEGLSWSTKALIYVLLSANKVDPKLIQLKVFSSSFTESELNEISNIAKHLVEKKRAQLQQDLNKMKAVFDLEPDIKVSDSFSMAVKLYDEFVNVLYYCKNSLNQLS